jgi:hypothetical protein
LNGGVTSSPTRRLTSLCIAAVLVCMVACANDGKVGVLSPRVPGTVEPAVLRMWREEVLRTRQELLRQLNGNDRERVRRTEVLLDEKDHVPFRTYSEGGRVVFGGGAVQAAWFWAKARAIDERTWPDCGWSRRYALYLRRQYPRMEDPIVLAGLHEGVERIEQVARDVFRAQVRFLVLHEYMHHIRGHSGQGSEEGLEAWIERSRCQELLADREAVGVLTDAAVFRGAVEFLESLLMVTPSRFAGGGETGWYPPDHERAIAVTQLAQRAASYNPEEYYAKTAVESLRIQALRFRYDTQEGAWLDFLASRREASELTSSGRSLETRWDELARAYGRQHGTDIDVRGLRDALWCAQREAKNGDGLAREGIEVLMAGNGLIALYHWSLVYSSEASLQKAPQAKIVPGGRVAAGSGKDDRERVYRLRVAGALGSSVGDSERVLRMLSQLSELQPENPEPAIQRGLLLKQVGKWEEAVNALHLGISLCRPDRDTALVTEAQRALREMASPS